MSGAAVQCASAAESGMVFAAIENGGNCSGCSWIGATGPITEETPATLQKFLTARAVDSPIVVFNSEGGDLIAGLKIGKILRAAHASTRVGVTRYDADRNAFIGDGGVCHSACAYAFMGGVDRAVGTGNKLGVHQFAPNSAPQLIDASMLNRLAMSQAQAVTAVLLEYVSQMGIATEVVSIASRGEEIRAIETDELQRMQIDNGTPPPSNWRLVPSGDGVIAAIDQMQGAGKGRRPTISIFCRRENPRQPLLTLSEPLSTWFRSQDWIQKKRERDEALGAVYLSVNDAQLRADTRPWDLLPTTTQYKKIRTSVKQNDGGETLVTEVALTRAQATMIMDRHAEFIQLSNGNAQYTMGVMDGWFPLEKSAPGAAPILQYAVQHCV